MICSKSSHFEICFRQLVPVVSSFPLLLCSFLAWHDSSQRMLPKEVLLCELFHTANTKMIYTWYAKHHFFLMAAWLNIHFICKGLESSSN